MQSTFRWLKWLCLGLAVMGIIIPGIIGWLTGTFSLQVVADWFQQRLVSLAALHETNPYAFQFRTALIIGLPTLFFFGAVGALAHLAEKISSAPRNTAEQVQKLEEDLERFLLVYNDEYDFVGRLRKLATKFDGQKFSELRDLVFEAVCQYCGDPSHENNETFLVVPGEKEALITVKNEQVSEAILENILDVKACNIVFTTGVSQLITLRRQRNLLMTPNNGLLPNCKSLLASPVLVGGEVRGIIGAIDPREKAFNADADQIFLELMASILGLAYTIRAKEVQK